MTTGHGLLRTERQGAVLRGQRDLRRLIPTRREGTGEKSAVGQGKQIGKYKKKKSVLKLRNA